MSRETLAKIESQLRWVSDFELACLAKALRVEVSLMFPSREKMAGMLPEFFNRLTHGNSLK